jgi:hypothetical protein
MRPLDYPALKVAAIAVWRLRSFLGLASPGVRRSSRCDLCGRFFTLLLDVSPIFFDGSGSRAMDSASYSPPAFSRRDDAYWIVAIFAARLICNCSSASL